MKQLICLIGFAMLLVTCQNRKASTYDKTKDTLTYYPLDSFPSTDKYARIDLTAEAKCYSCRQIDNLFVFKDVSACLLEGTEIAKQIPIKNFLWNEDSLYFLHRGEIVNAYNTHGKFLYTLDENATSCDIDISSKRVVVYDNQHKQLNFYAFTGNLIDQYSLSDSLDIGDVRFVNPDLLLLAANTIPLPETYYYDLHKQAVKSVQKAPENVSYPDSMTLNLRVREIDDKKIPLFVFYNSPEEGLFGKYQFSDYLYHYTDSGVQVRKVFDIGDRRIKISHTARFKPETSFFIRFFAETNQYFITQYFSEGGEMGLHGDFLGAALSIRDKQSGAGDEGFFITLPKQIIYLGGRNFLSFSKNQRFLFGIRYFHEKKPTVQEEVTLPDSLKRENGEEQLLITKFEL